MRPYRGRRRFEISDPIVEPLWSGVRVMVHIDRASRPEDEPAVRVVEDLGADLATELPALAAAIGSAVLAVDAIVDGVVSRQVGLESTGTAPIPELRTSSTSMFVRNAELDVAPRGASTPDDAAEGFIAFDLLRLDGTVLVDVPLLERKRLLESVLVESDLVRRSIHVRPPIDAWIGTWRSMGLRGGILKAANSRYRPGNDSIEWRLVERVGRRG